MQVSPHLELVSPPIAASDLDATSILLVDDQPSNLIALAAVLEPLGHRLVSAASGQEALKQIVNHDFAVILMDVQMPGLDGFETAAFIKTHIRARNIPIIFVTGASRDVAHTFKGYSHGAVDYLLKPVDADILRSKVSVFVDLFRKGEQIKRQEALLRQRDRARLQRANAQTLAESEERYRSLVLATAQIVWTANVRGEITTDSPSWLAFTGQSAEAHRGMGWLDAVHPNDRERTRKLWVQAVLCKAQYDTEYQLRQSDGGYRRMSVRSVPVRNEDGTIREWIGANVDITDRRTAEEERERLLAREVAAREAAQEAVRIRDDFLAIASHELNTPLTPLRLQIDMLRQREVSAECRERSLATIDRQVGRMARLIDQLLDVSRIRADRLALDPEEVDVALVVRDVAARFANAIPGGCEVRVRADTSAMVYVDRLRLEQVITNLMTNAIKYGDGKPVDLCLDVTEGSCRVSVEDRGIGIDLGSQARIFDRFERAVSVRHYGGFGLGLWIARQIVEASGGTIAVTSTPGKGSLFTVDLPLRTAGPDSPHVRQM